MKKVILLSLLAFAVASLLAQDPALYRTIDGRQNNLDNPEWGAAGTPLLRVSGNGYVDSISAPAGPDRPNPRFLSNLIFSQDGLLSDPLNMSDFTWVFGQFMDHDLGLTVDGTESMDIDVPPGDPQFDPMGFGTVKIHMLRNKFMEGTGTSPDNPRQFINELTAFIDGSAVYGSDIETANWLRSFEGGKLKVSAGNLMPYNTIDGEFDSPVDPDAPHMDDAVGFATRLFVAGDPRANENPLLASYHTIFVREHNRQCDLLAVAHPDWNDEQLYQHARKMVGGLIQSVTYNEWLPTMGVELATYTGYKSDVHPQLANVFTAAAFRLGHTLLNSNILRVDNDGNLLPQGNLTLRQAFFNPLAIPEVGGIEPYFAGMAQQVQQNMDSRIVDDVRNFLFGPPGAGGLDLAAINIMRGRERGLPSFNDIREAYGLPRITFMGEVTPEIITYSQIFEAYFGNVERMDPWVAMLAEQEMSGRLFGPTITAIMRTQFEALRDGDRFFYLNDPVLTDREKDWIHNTTMRDIIMYNTSITLMQDNVFLAMPFEDICTNMTTEVGGQVVVHTSLAEMPNAEVILTDASDATATAITDNTGDFIFGALPACEAVSISPVYEGDQWINGITVQDIIILSRHILGIEEITDPYQLLAADVDLSGSIRVQDIIALRRLILDFDQQFTGDLPMWNFIPSNYLFSNPTEPWNDNYPTAIDLSSPTMMVENQNFIAFKRGDVNASAELDNDDNFNSDYDLLARNTTPGLHLAVPDQMLLAGQTTEVLLRIHGPAPAEVPAEKISYQYSLGLTDGSIDAVTPINLNPGYVNLTQRGRLRFCGELTTKEDLVSVRLTSQTNGSLAELLEIKQQEIPAFAVTERGSLGSISLDFTGANAPGAANAMALYSKAFPNPFKGELQIEFPVTEPGVGSVAIYDLNGRMVLQEQRQLSAGVYLWSVNTSQLASGTYLYRVNTTTGTFQGKVVK
ncbi:MAG: peroxidase family protein [Bacteroidota bacterium]